MATVLSGVDPAVNLTRRAVDALADVRTSLPGPRPGRTMLEHREDGATKADIERCTAAEPQTTELVELAEEAMAGLKLRDCLPDQLAQIATTRRLADPPAVAAVLRAPIDQTG